MLSKEHAACKFWCVNCPLINNMKTRANAFLSDGISLVTEAYATQVFFVMFVVTSLYDVFVVAVVCVSL